MNFWANPNTHVILPLTNHIDQKVNKSVANQLKSSLYIFCTKEKLVKVFGCFIKLIQFSSLNVLRG